ncbi:hypothetical protein, partial [Mycobacteroides abscessus]|uniref:hypothetical protein n=1 Tax=Mycobacteroides abscessus TaxID=36809 RepID=UPI00130014B1
MSVLVAVLVSCVDGLALDLPVAWSVVLGCFVELLPVPVLEDVVPAVEEFSVVLRLGPAWSAADFLVPGFSIFGPVALGRGLSVSGCFVELLPVLALADDPPAAEEFSVVLRLGPVWSVPVFW